MNAQTATASPHETRPRLSAAEICELTRRVIPDEELTPTSVDDVGKLPSFLSKMRVFERALGSPYSQIEHDAQDALTLRRLRQLANTVLLNPAWRERLAAAGVAAAPESFEEWQRIPLSDKALQHDFFMGARPGLVARLEEGDFQIVASGGTSGGKPVETVYAKRELADTYELAGEFMGRHQLRAHMGAGTPKWVYTTLADYQMWSSGAMVGGVLQRIPDVNYIGAGPVSASVFEHMFSYPGPKALMGISAGIATLGELGAGLSPQARATFRVALYGSGVLPHRKRAELHSVYPNLAILSYFAATQAETIGLQLQPASPILAAVPGLHLVEIVDEAGRWVAEGEEGELVVTRLHAHEAPLLRLKLGDRMIRRPRLDGSGLRTQQFEFAGRSGDVLHLNDTQYSAARAYTTLCEDLKAANVLDLAAAAHETQFVNHREAKTVTLVASVDDALGAQYRVSEVLGPHGVQHLFVGSLTRSLSVFNQWEADPAAIARTGYRFEIRFVPPRSPEIARTSVGKVPLVRDRG